MDSIFIEGRKDATPTKAEADGRYYRQTCIEEHYVIVGEPSGFDVSHVTPDDSSGIKIAEAIFAVVTDAPQEQKLKIIGSDSTTVMTVAASHLWKPCWEDLCNGQYACFIWTNFHYVMSFQCWMAQPLVPAHFQDP